MKMILRIGIVVALVVAAGLTGAGAFADPVRKKTMADFLRPGYPVYLAQTGFTQFEPSVMNSLADKAAEGLDRVVPAGCDGEAFARDLCGLKIRTAGSTVMAPTIGERDLIAERPYGDAKPERGDILIFRKAGESRSQLYVMRIIGLPGDRVALQHGTVLVNDAPLAQTPTGAVATDMVGDPLTVMREGTPENRDYTIALKSDRSRVVGSADDRAAVAVPEGQYYVLGDNRHNAADSRFPDLMGEGGFIPAANISGKIVSIVASADEARIGKVLD